MPAAAVAIPAAISAGTSIFGALTKRNAANKMQQDMLAALTRAGGIATDATNQVNPQILGAADQWGNRVMGAGESAAAGAEEASRRGQEQIGGAVTAGQESLKPYGEAGTSALDTLSRLLQKPQQFQYQADPGYQFRLAEGQKQIARMAAAKGAAGGGGTAKALAQYNSGLASQEFGSAWDRWNTQQKQRESGLGTLASMGERAGEFGADLGFRGAGASANLGQRAAEYGGQARTGSTQWAGEANINAVNKTGQNQLDLANFLANLQLGEGQTRGATDIQKGNISGGLISSLGGIASGLPWGDWLKKTPKTAWGGLNKGPE